MPQWPARRSRDATVAALLGRVEGRAAAQGFQLDDAQRGAARTLSELAATVTTGRRPGLGGAYLCGPVGRGKTWLMDAFFAEVPTGRKTRFHFQVFFRDLQRAVDHHGIGRRAIQRGLADLLGDARVVCFDEFQAYDAGDATLLNLLLREVLVERRATLVITSNQFPDDLFPHPAYHVAFAPAIAMIKERLEVSLLDGGVDYRTLCRSAPPAGFRSGAYVVGDASTAPGVVLPASALGTPEPLDVAGRLLHAKHADPEAGVVVFGFDELCARPVSAFDVLTLCERFSTWAIDDVPLLSACTADVVQRFVNFVDVLHDLDRRLVLRSRYPLDEVLVGDGLPADVARTASRLRLLSAVT